MNSRRIFLVRGVLALVILLVWQAMAMSGLLYRDVVPGIERIVIALVGLLASADLYGNLAVTAGEVLFAIAIGGIAGLAIGIFIGGSRLLTGAYEPFLHYLGPTPKIIFFPVMIMLFGVGPASKVAMGAVSAFFPVALSAAAAMQHINPVFIRVGRSFRASPWQMTMKVLLPAMRAPLLNGIRLGFGIAVIGTLLAETKLSNKGLGYLIIQSYVQFDMPRMYSILIVVFILAAAVNVILDRLAGGLPDSKRN